MNASTNARAVIEVSAEDMEEVNSAVSMVGLAPPRGVRPREEGGDMETAHAAGSGVAAQGGVEHAGSLGGDGSLVGDDRAWVATVAREAAA